MTRLLAVLSLLSSLIVPVGATALVSGCEPSDGKANKTTSKRYDPNLPASRRICLVVEHLDSNDDTDKDHGVTPKRSGTWQTGGRAPGCVVQVKREGRTKEGKEPPWVTVARGNNAEFHIVDGVHKKFRALNCGPRDYNITAGYGVFHIECLTNQQWGARGKSCKEHNDCK